MKRMLAALLLAIVLAAPLCDARDTISHTFASIVRIESTDENDNKTTCTGFMVAPRRALTAVHCVPEDAGFTVDGVDALVIKRDSSLALVSAGDKPTLKIAKTLRLQQDVTVFGFGWTDMYIFSRRVARFQGGDFALDGPLAPGMSGGPAVNKDGEVVGLNQASNAVIGILCGAGELQAFLR